MSRMAQKQDTRQDKKVKDIVDRPRMSWILNLVLNQKTQQEIVKDIADGILDFKEIEDIFPWKFVQGLRRCTPDHAQNYLNRFKNMTDDRMKGLLTEMMSRKSRDEIVKLITDHSLNLDDIQKSYLRSYTMENKENEESESSMTSNISVNSEKMLSEGTRNVNNKIENMKEPKDTITKKKRNITKKGEKVTDTKKKGNDAEKATKKVRVVKSRNEKRVGDINGGNKEEETNKEISSAKENPLNDFAETLMQTRNEGFEESPSHFSEEDQAAYELPVRCVTKKTVNSKNLASGVTKLVNAKKASQKVGKSVKRASRNKENHEVDNFASLSRSTYSTKENEKSKDDSDVENENAKTSYVIENDCFRATRINGGHEDSLQKSQTNQMTDITSITVSKNQDIYGNKENELNHIQKNNFNIELNTSTPKKLNCETKTIRIKEEPKSECSFSEFDHPIDDRYEEKDLNIAKDAVKNIVSQKKLQTKRSKVRSNSKASSANIQKSKKVTEPSTIAKAKKTSGRTKKEITGRRANDPGRKESTKDRRTKNRRKEQMRRSERKIQKAMAQFSEQVTKLVKNMGYLEDDDESSSSYSSKSSYSSSSESCSCSSCDCSDYSSSDDYSEYTLCSCSNCGSSSSNTDFDSDPDSDSDSDSDYDREE